jgi:hypothetical protein
LQQWRADEWQLALADGYRPWTDDLCVVKEDIQVAGHEVTLYHGYSEAVRRAAGVRCPTDPADHYIALVEVGATVVRVAAAPRSPFSEEDAMREVIAALAPVN